MNSERFPKSEKLCGKIRVKSLYDNGKHFTCYPLRVTYVIQDRSLQNPAPAPQSSLGNTQILIWAPKSLFRHAVDRNLLRRRMREAYRLNATPLRDYSALHNLSMQIAFNYIAKEELPFLQIEKAVKKAINKLMDTKQD